MVNSTQTTHYAPFTIHQLVARIFLGRWCAKGRRGRLQQLAAEENRPGRGAGRRATLGLERHSVSRAVDGDGVVICELRPLRELLVADQPEGTRRPEAVGHEPQLVGLAGLALGSP